VEFRGGTVFLPKLTVFLFLVTSAGLVFSLLRGLKSMNENFKKILEFADQVVERFPDRRDCLKIQAGPLKGGGFASANSFVAYSS
jgi:hypothetical protein